MDAEDSSRGGAGDPAQAGMRRWPGSARVRPIQYRSWPWWDVWSGRYGRRVVPKTPIEYS